MGNLTLLFLLKQVSSLASSLSAGGINASMTGSIGTLASAIKASAKGSAKDIKAMQAGGQAVGRWAANKFNSIRKAG